MSLKTTIRFIRNHAFNAGYQNRAVLSFFMWQLKSRLFPGPFRHRFTNRSILMVKRKMHGATGNIYCGLHEFEDMAFLMHYLRPGELFADIGANVGTYSVLASSHVGARVIAAEPMPDAYSWLKKNIQENNVSHLVSLVNKAVASKPGHLHFTNHLDAMNHVAAKNDGDNTMMVEVQTLDDLLKDEIPILIKIDVEGYETEVINGGLKTLESNKLQAVIIELNGAGYHFGFDEEAIHEKMLLAGFSPFFYKPFERNLVPAQTHGHHNTIYLRKPGDALERVKQAPAFKVRNKII